MYYKLTKIKLTKLTKKIGYRVFCVENLHNIPSYVVIDICKHVYKLCFASCLLWVRKGKT